MRNARLAVVAVALLGLGLSGCGRVYDQTTTADARRGPNAGRDPAGITVSEGGTDRRYQSLGQIRTQVRPLNVFSPTPTRADVDDALRREAARLGADAVINVRYGAAGTDVLGLAAGGPLASSQTNGTGEAVIWAQ